MGGQTEERKNHAHAGTTIVTTSWRNLPSRRGVSGEGFDAFRGRFPRSGQGFFVSRLTVKGRGKPLSLRCPTEFVGVNGTSPRPYENSPLLNVPSGYHSCNQLFALKLNTFLCQNTRFIRVLYLTHLRNHVSKFDQCGGGVATSNDDVH